MARLVSIAFVLLVPFFARSYGQQVEIPRDTHNEPVAVTKSGKAVAEASRAQASPLHEQAPVAAPLKAIAVKTQPAITQVMKVQPLKIAMGKTEPALTSPTFQPFVSSSDSAFTKLADGFDFPVG